MPYLEIYQLHTFSYKFDYENKRSFDAPPSRSSTGGAHTLAHILQSSYAITSSNTITNRRLMRLSHSSTARTHTCARTCTRTHACTCSTSSYTHATANFTYQNKRSLNSTLAQQHRGSKAVKRSDQLRLHRHKWHNFRHTA